MTNKNGKWSGLAAIITVGMVLSGASAFAADNGNVVLSGTVAPVNAIVVTPVSGYNALDMTAGAVNQQVATVNEKNNDQSGYTVTLASLNATTTQAFLKGAAGSTNTVNYSMKYGPAGSEVDVTLVTGSGVVSSTSAASIEAGAEKSLLINFIGSSWKNADTYSDTITLTIAGK